MAIVKKIIMKLLASLNGLQDLHGLLIFCILSEEKKKQENGSWPAGFATGKNHNILS